MLFSAIKLNRDAITVFGDERPARATEMCLIAPTDLKISWSFAKSRSSVRRKAQNLHVRVRPPRGLKAPWSLSPQLHPIPPPQKAPRHRRNGPCIPKKEVTPGQLAMAQHLFHRPKSLTWISMPLHSRCLVLSNKTDSKLPSYSFSPIMAVQQSIPTPATALIKCGSQCMRKHRLNRPCDWQRPRSLSTSL